MKNEKHMGDRDGIISENERSPFFSIIVPVYNAEEYIERTISSVKDQDFSDWELILVNDGSTDISLELMKKYEDENLKIIDKTNSGVSDSRNVGIKNSQGKWIIFLDADDFLEKGSLDLIFSCLNSNEVDMLITNFYHVLPSGRKRKDRKITEKSTSDIKTVLDALFRQSQWHSIKWYGNLHSIWAKCFKASIIKDNNIYFKEKIKIGEDMIFVLEYILKTSKIKFIDSATYNYQHNNLSTMNTLKWEGIEQGKIYFDTAIELVGNKVSEEAKVDFWLEIEERHWHLLHFSNLGIKKKYIEFKKLFQENNYQTFSKKGLVIIDSAKIRVYLFLIRHSMVFSLMILSYIREKKMLYNSKKM